MIALLNVQAQEPGLLILQLGDQLGLGVPDLDDGLLADGDQLLDGRSAPRHLFGRELDRPLDVVALHGVLDQLRGHIDPLRTAGAVDPATTEEVGVLGAVAAGADAVGEALLAGIAKDAALEVVAVLLRAFARHPLLVKQCLHPVEGVLVNQRLVPSPEGLLVRRAALVDDPPGVVRVAQNALQGRSPDLVFRPSLCLP